MLGLQEQDLVEAGWPSEPAVIAALMREAEALEAKGINDRSYALKLLARKFPLPESAPGMRSAPLEFAEAIRAESEEEEKNLGAVRRFMGELMRCPVVERGVILPDACPAGGEEASIPVGGAIAARRAILPGAHGSDICCSLYATFFQSRRQPSELLDDIMSVTRFGPGGRPVHDRVNHSVLEEPVWANRFLKGLEEHARAHLADQGDGNHFAFLGEISWGEGEFATLDAAGHVQFAKALRENRETGRRTLALVTHHGSRGLGAHVFKRGLQAAVKQTAKEAGGIPEAAAWLSLDSPEGQAYWEALQYVSRWTLANHQCIHDRFLAVSGSDRVFAFGNEHNFVWQRGELFYHGKGATPAWPDEAGRPRLGLVPLNMSSPVLLVLGENREDCLSFAPHGAGRNLSRRALVRTFEEPSGRIDTAAMEVALRNSTNGIGVRWFLGQPDFAESPLAYKSPEKVRSQIEAFGLARVVGGILPLGSIMAGRQVRGIDEELTPKQERQLQHRSERRRQKQGLRQEVWSDQDE